MIAALLHSPFSKTLEHALATLRYQKEVVKDPRVAVIAEQIFYFSNIGRQSCHSQADWLNPAMNISAVMHFFKSQDLGTLIAEANSCTSTSFMTIKVALNSVVEACQFLTEQKVSISTSKLVADRLLANLVKAPEKALGTCAGSCLHFAELYHASNRPLNEQIDRYLISSSRSLYYQLLHMLMQWAYSSTSAKHIEDLIPQSDQLKPSLYRLWPELLEQNFCSQIQHELIPCDPLSPQTISDLAGKYPQASKLTFTLYFQSPFDEDHHTCLYFINREKSEFGMLEPTQHFKRFTSKDEMQEHLLSHSKGFMYGRTLHAIEVFASS